MAQLYFRYSTMGAGKSIEVQKVAFNKATTIARVIDGKIVKEGDQILIGGNANYIPLCRKHYKQGLIVPYKEIKEDLITRREKMLIEKNI